MSKVYRPLPTSQDVADSHLPAFRIAARQKLPFVARAIASPFLAFFLRAAIEIVVRWIVEWLKEREEPVPPSLAALARGVAWDMMPEVRTGLTLAARGETGE